jgi:hypothetical protein
MMLVKKCLCISVFGILTGALSMAAVNAKDTIGFQKTAAGANWGWREEMSGPTGCISQCGDKYDIRLVSRKNDRYAFSITILSGDREIYTWQGHRHSVFRILDDRLYYAKFHPSSTGGSIVAIDLTTGRELWTSPLKALGDFEHSTYRTLLNLDCNHEVVTIYGNESLGRYFEIKRTDTGATVGHKRFGHASQPDAAITTPAGVFDSLVTQIAALATHHAELAGFPDYAGHRDSKLRIAYQHNLNPVLKRHPTPVLTKRRLRPTDLGDQGIVLQFILDDGTNPLQAPIDTVTDYPNLKHTLYAELILWEQAAPELKRKLEDILSKHKALLAELDQQAADKPRTSR